MTGGLQEEPMSASLQTVCSLGSANAVPQGEDAIWLGRAARLRMVLVQAEGDRRICFSTCLHYSQCFCKPVWQTARHIPAWGWEWTRVGKHGVQQDMPAHLSSEASDLEALQCCPGMEWAVVNLSGLLEKPCVLASPVPWASHSYKPRVPQSKLLSLLSLYFPINERAFDLRHFQLRQVSSTVLMAKMRKKFYMLNMVWGHPANQEGTRGTSSAYQKACFQLRCKGNGSNTPDSGEGRTKLFLFMGLLEKLFAYMLQPLGNWASDSGLSLLETPFLTHQQQCRLVNLPGM